MQMSERKAVTGCHAEKGSGMMQQSHHVKVPLM